MNLTVKPDPRIQTVIEAVLSDYGPRLETRKRFGKQIHRSLTDALNATDGLIADAEDSRCFLPPQVITWRNLLTNLPDPTPGRRAIDIVVYHRDQPNIPAALIEVESSLDDLWGATTRSGYYTVLSLAKNGEREHFVSYKSLERMAIAALLAANPTVTTPEVEKLDGSLPAVHNPLALPIYLVTGWRRETDNQVLEPRLNSLGAELICGRVFPDRKGSRAFRQVLAR